jgi:hypothetical protein
MMDIQRLVEWLGPAGANAGILASRLSLHELIDIARARGLPLSPKPSRKEIANELVYSGSKKIEKSVDELLAMNSDDLVDYFSEINPSRSEIITLLASLGVGVSGEASRHLFKFAAGEISDLGMYQRVARGSQRR